MKPPGHGRKSLHGRGTEGVSIRIQVDTGTGDRFALAGEHPYLENDTAAEDDLESFEVAVHGDHDSPHRLGGVALGLDPQIVGARLEAGDLEPAARIGDAQLALAPCADSLIALLDPAERRASDRLALRPHDSSREAAGRPHLEMERSPEGSLHAGDSQGNVALVLDLEPERRVPGQIGEAEAPKGVAASSGRASARSWRRVGTPWSVSGAAVLDVTANPPGHKCRGYSTALDESSFKVPFRGR